MFGELFLNVPCAYECVQFFASESKCEREKEREYSEETKTDNLFRGTEWLFSGVFFLGH